MAQRKVGRLDIFLATSLLFLPFSIFVPIANAPEIGLTLMPVALTVLACRHILHRGNKPLSLLWFCMAAAFTLVLAAVLLGWWALFAFAVGMNLGDSTLSSAVGALMALTPGSLALAALHLRRGREGPIAISSKGRRASS